MAKNVIHVGGYAVRKPKGGLTPQKRNAISALASEKRLSNASGCTIVFFGSRAVQRCENRRLKAHNKRQCRNKKKLFVKCAGRKRR